VLDKFGGTVKQHPKAVATNKSATCEEALDFNVIHDTFRPKILRYLTRLTGAQEAEDLTQLVMVRVSEGLAQFRGDSLLSTWIYRVATNAALDRLRSRGLRAQMPLIAAGEAEPDSTDDAEELAIAEPRGPSAEVAAIRDEMNACIREFVDRLPDPYRTVVVLSEIEGFKNREIADSLGVSLDSVKIRLHRAREKLKQDLAAGCTFDRDERNELACDRKLAPPSPA
jgi:RNA polymerase sigma-70 factor (ECF subfamily)